jgi:1,4-alpha-glucan branching enzyme
MNLPPYEADGWSLMQWFNDSVDNRAADKVCIAEQLPNDPWITRPTSLGGAGFDSQWHDAFNDNLRQEILDAALGDPEMWKIANIINGSGTYLSNTNVVNYLELHDECMTQNGGRIVRQIDPSWPHDDTYAKGRIKLAQGLVMFAPGIPTIHQGSEWLEDTDFGGGDPGGANRINWALKTANAPIFQYFKDIIATRRSNGAFRSNAGHQVFHVDESGNVVAFQRYDASGNVCVVVANFGNGDYYNYRLGFPQAGHWQELINSQSSLYDGNTVGNSGGIDTENVPYDGYGQSASITIPQMGLLVFRFGSPPPPDCPGDTNGDNVVDNADLQAILDAWASETGDPNYDAGADLNDDGQVENADLQELLDNWARTCL